MRKLAALTALLLLPSFAFSFDCPEKSSGERTEDCPWAGVARLLNERAAVDGGLEKIFSADAPGLLRQLDADRANAAVLKLWGKSVNYDELAKGEIVNPAILAFLSARLGVAGPRGKIIHAGVDHTYGYLFSLLPTSFGYKRARWVRPDIETGLGLPRGSLGPSPSEGTLLGNVTCLAGGIALKDDKAAMALLKKTGAYCSGAVKKFSFAAVGHERVSEEVVLPGGRKVVLRTDLVPFRKEAGGNSHLLVYSVYDSSLKRAYLVTAFPVNSSFAAAAVSPSGLGADKPVLTRYNAYVEGLTDAGEFKGTRTAAWMKK